MDSYFVFSYTDLNKPSNKQIDNAFVALSIWSKRCERESKWGKRSDSVRHGCSLNARHALNQTKPTNQVGSNEKRF